MLANLRILAVMEETYLTDYNRYATAPQLRHYDFWPDDLRLRTGQVVVVHLDLPWGGYCLAGRVAPHRFYIYDSENGGVGERPRTRDRCSTTTFPTFGGRLRP